MKTFPTLLFKVLFSGITLFFMTVSLYLYLKTEPVSAQTVRKECDLKVESVEQIGTARRFSDNEGDEFKCKVTISGNEKVASENLQCNIEFEDEEYTSKLGGACSSDAGLGVTWEPETGFTELTFTCIFPADLDVPEGKEDELELVARQMRGFDNCTYDSEEEEKEATEDREKRTELRVSNLGRSRDTIDGESSIKVAYQFLEDLFAEMDGYTDSDSGFDDDDDRDSDDDSGSSTSDGVPKVSRSTHEDIEDIRVSYGEWGLPNPNTSQARQIAEGWYNDPKKRWNVQQLLLGEARLTNEGGLDVKNFVTTGWIMFEGAEIYARNCQDNPNATLRQNVAYACNCGEPRGGSRNGLLQTAGYQACDRAVRDDYTRVFNKCYPSGDPAEIMTRVYENSDKATNPRWSYKAQRNFRSSPGTEPNLIREYYSDVDDVTRSNLNRYIANSKAEFADPRVQFMTLLLGKDPCMVIGLNSFAVSDSDLKAALINSRGWTSYINRQTLANTIEAARVFWERYPRLFVQSERDRDRDREDDDDDEDNRSSRRRRSSNDLPDETEYARAYVDSVLENCRTGGVRGRVSSANTACLQVVQQKLNDGRAITKGAVAGVTARKDDITQEQSGTVKGEQSSRRTKIKYTDSALSVAFREIGLFTYYQCVLFAKTIAMDTEAALKNKNPDTTHSEWVGRGWAAQYIKNPPAGYSVYPINQCKSKVKKGQAFPIVWGGKYGHIAIGAFFSNTKLFILESNFDWKGSLRHRIAYVDRPNTGLPDYCMIKNN